MGYVLMFMDICKHQQDNSYYVDNSDALLNNSVMIQIIFHILHILHFRKVCGVFHCFRKDFEISL